jgi:hypothetical protein
MPPADTRAKPELPIRWNSDRQVVILNTIVPRCIHADHLPILSVFSEQDPLKHFTMI